MIGGNDVGFGRVAGCFIQLDCDQTPVPAVTLQLVQQLGSRLDAAYAAIRASAPNARVVVTLYPSLLPADPSVNLSRCPEINQAEVRLGNQIQEGLNQTISDRARAHGFAVADPRPGFAGHDVCAGRQTFFYRPGTPGTYHPNLAGCATDHGRVRRARYSHRHSDGSHPVRLTAGPEDVLSAWASAVAPATRELPRFGVPVAPIRLVAGGAHRNRMKRRGQRQRQHHASESRLRCHQTVGLSPGVARLSTPTRFRSMPDWSAAGGPGDACIRRFADSPVGIERLDERVVPSR